MVTLQYSGGSTLVKGLSNYHGICLALDSAYALQLLLYKRNYKVVIRMEFQQNRGAQRPQASHPSATPQPGATTPGGTPSQNKKSGANGKAGSLLSIQGGSIVMLFSATILLVALIVFIAIGGPRAEQRFVEDDKFQAVFLNGGQVYFGQVTNLNDQYMRLVDIYYLRVNQPVQPAEGAFNEEGEISLVKLGCELHGPKDEMLINRDQIVFWENLKTDGQVTQAIATFRAENPDGQDCAQPDQGATAPAPVTDSPEAPAPEENGGGTDEETTP
jgi:hypothetical protein